MVCADDENEEEETNDSPINRAQAETLIRMYLKSGKFKEAIQIWKTFEDFDVEGKENIEDIMEEFLVRLKEIYTTMGMMEMVTGYLSEEDLKKLETLKVLVVILKTTKNHKYCFSRKKRNFSLRQWHS